MGEERKGEERKEERGKRPVGIDADIFLFHRRSAQPT
jgi:hypothetical protein